MKTKTRHRKHHWTKKRSQSETILARKKTCRKDQLKGEEKQQTWRIQTVLQSCLVNMMKTSHFLSRKNYTEKLHWWSNQLSWYCLGVLYRKDFYIIREAIPTCMLFYTVCKQHSTPPRFTQTCRRFFEMNVKKCINVCCDKNKQNNVQIGGEMSNLII